MYFMNFSYTIFKNRGLSVVCTAWVHDLRSYNDLIASGFCNQDGDGANYRNQWVMSR